MAPEQTGISFADDELVGVLRRVAAALETDTLTSPGYDDYRRRLEPSLPSSTLIRKHFGGWRPGVRAAGLRAVGDSTHSERSRPATALSSLRRARRETRGPLSRAVYSDWHRQLAPRVREQAPSEDEIIEFFGDWHRALSAAGIRNDDVLHPDALWTSAEARAIRHQIEVETGEPLSASSYAEVVATKARKPLPSWQVLRELLEM